MKTYSAKPTDVTRQWFIIDASEAPLGRIASQAAVLLLGKHKPQFTKHIDCGDYVIVINANQIVTTGNKLEKKIYYRHSGYQSGLTATSLREALDQDPTHPVYKAIRNMLPVNRLRADRLKRLKIYATSDHQHEAQKPVKFAVKEKI